MLDPIYIADLLRADYPRYRKKDPTLPPTFEEWEVATAERALRFQRSGVPIIRHLIHFDAFVERNGILHISSFDEVTRDDYADEQARAEAVSSSF